MEAILDSCMRLMHAQVVARTRPVRGLHYVRGALPEAALFRRREQPSELMHRGTVARKLHRNGEERAEGRGA